mmetsp:Transcript_30783/g.100214  ORF Transcript_30783/g.100214 Transcript_30783/m.100214 type:complete len:308 (-) Transcript_30783:1510-2433(-)
MHGALVAPLVLHELAGGLIARWLVLDASKQALQPKIPNLCAKKIILLALRLIYVFGELQQLRTLLPHATHQLPLPHLPTSNIQTDEVFPLRKQICTAIGFLERASFTSSPCRRNHESTSGCIQVSVAIDLHTRTSCVQARASDVRGVRSHLAIVRQRKSICVSLTLVVAADVSFSLRPEVELVRVASFRHLLEHFHERRWPGIRGIDWQGWLLLLSIEPDRVPKLLPKLASLLGKKAHIHNLASIDDARSGLSDGPVWSNWSVNLPQRSHLLLYAVGWPHRLFDPPSPFLRLKFLLRRCWFWRWRRG